MSIQDVNTIANRLSLREPQRDSLKILDRVLEISNLTKGADVGQILEIIQSEFPSVKDFERHAWARRLLPYPLLKDLTDK